MRLEPVDDLKLLHLAGAGKKIDQNPIEREGRQVAPLELRHRDVLDEGGLRVGLGVCLIEAIDVLDQRMVCAAVAFGEQKTACVSAVRRDAADTRRMFPDGERRVAVTNHSRGRLDENGSMCPRISGGIATTPCGASSVPRRWALPRASMIRNCASTPVGRPRSIPIEVTCRLRIPPPVAMTSLNFASAATMASTSG